MVGVWNGGRNARDCWSHESLRGLNLGTSDKAIEPLSTEKGLELTLPKEKILLCELDSHTVDYVERGRAIRF